MSSSFAELYGMIPTVDPVTPAEARSALNLGSEISDDELALLIFAARVDVETDAKLCIARQKWNVPAHQLGDFLPHQVVGQSRGGVDIECGYTAADLPADLRDAVLQLVAWAFASRDTGWPYANADPRPTFTHLRRPAGEVVEQDPPANLLDAVSSARRKLSIPSDAKQVA